MRRRSRLLMLASLLTLALLAPARGAAAASDRLPDLAMAKLQHLSTDSDGTRRESWRATFLPRCGRDGPTPAQAGRRGR